MPTLTIDEIKVEVPEGTTVLQAARQAGVKIPTLCFLDDVQSIGACRVCLVEVEGARTLVASCSQPATDGMVVKTNTGKVRDGRKMVVELLLSRLPGCQVHPPAVQVGTHAQVAQHRRQCALLGVAPDRREQHHGGLVAGETKPDPHGTSRPRSQAVAPRPAPSVDATP